MDDEIIRELWQIKESIAKEHDYNVEALVTHLRAMRVGRDLKLVDLRSNKRAIKRDIQADCQ
ncbi:MAG: hypothetical protein M0Z41_03400 [Peptococcaceae bacterium]|nr:hypothetical protein [Peptococcaceae bacterium]